MVSTVPFLVTVVIVIVHETLGRSPVKCPACPRGLVNPTCGSDGQLYEDECHLRQSSCESGVRIQVVRWNQCRPMTCITGCPYNFEDVCGEDGEIHSGNRCTFLWDSCGKRTPLREAPMEFCEQARSKY